MSIKNDQSGPNNQDTSSKQHDEENGKAHLTDPGTEGRGIGSPASMPIDKAAKRNGVSASKPEAKRGGASLVTKNPKKMDGADENANHPYGGDYSIKSQSLFSNYYSGK